MIPQYIKDLQAYLEEVPYGVVELKIERVNRKTVAIHTEGRETLRYEDNEEALRDIFAILKNLVDTNYSGQAHVECTYKDGNIKIVAIHDTKENKY